jgi:hypothetical protein
LKQPRHRTRRCEVYEFKWCSRNGCQLIWDRSPAEGANAAVKYSWDCGPPHWQLVIASYTVSRASERRRRMAQQFSFDWERGLCKGATD